MKIFRLNLISLIIVTTIFGYRLIDAAELPLSNPGESVEEYNQRMIHNVHNDICQQIFDEMFHQVAADIPTRKHLDRMGKMWNADYLKAFSKIFQFSF